MRRLRFVKTSFVLLLASFVSFHSLLLLFFFFFEVLFSSSKRVQCHTVTTNGFVVVGSFRGRQRPNRRKKGSVYRGFGRRRCFSRRFGVKARRTRRKHRHSFTSLRLSFLTFLGEIHRKKASFKTACLLMMSSRSEDVVEEENNDVALWRLFRNAGGAFSGGVCRDVVERHVLPRLNRNDEILFTE